MGKSSPPPAPDFEAAAREQGQANVDAARSSSKLNNPQVISPYGTQTVTYGSGFDQAGYDQALSRYQAAQEQAALYPKFKFNLEEPNRNDFILGDPDVPTITQKFSPEQEALYRMEVGNKAALGQLAGTGIQNAQGILGSKLDFGGLPGMPGSASDTRNKVISAMMSRVNEDYGRNRDQANSDLIAAGIRPGSQAYDSRMALLDRGLNDARQQAILAAGAEAQRDFGMDADRRRSAIAELLQLRQAPLNEITALMSGSQVQNPFAMPGYAQNAQVAPAPMFAATNAAGQYATDVYNAQQAQQGALMSGLFGLGSAGLMAGMMPGGYFGPALPTRT